MSRHGHRLHLTSGVWQPAPSQLAVPAADDRWSAQVQCLDLDEEHSLSVELSVGSVAYRSFKTR